MKATQINPTNVSIALIYCVIGILSFFVLKIVSRYFQDNIKRKIEVQKGKITQQDVRRVNFSKIFIRSYFMKSTLIGSMINSDKKHLLRELLVLSCIGVSCFHINSYILWPSAVGIGVFIATFVISQVMMPMLDEKSRKVVVDQFYSSSIKRKPSVIDSNSIQIQHTELQLTIKNQTQRQGQSRDLTKSDKAQLLFILIMTVITEILFCQSVLTLTLSVSNSGILNLLSFGLSVAIDQLAARIAIGLVGYLVCFVLFKTQRVNFFENKIFVSFCYEYLAQEIKAVHSQRIIQEMQHKISSINNPEIHFSESIHERINTNHDESNFNQNATEMKIIPQFFEEASQQICSEIQVVISKVLPIGGLLEEPQIEVQEEKVSQTIEEVQEQEQSAQLQEVQQTEQSQQVNDSILSPPIHQTQLIPQVPIINEEIKIDTKPEINYFEFFQHDLSMFDDTKAYQEVKHTVIKITKKKFPKPQPKFKKDPLLYFPYEEHKLSHKTPVQQQLKENQQNETIFSRDISTIDQNIMNTISIADCTEISIVKEENEISFVLQQKNTNMKNLAINPKPRAIYTQRPAKNKLKQGDENLQSMRKVSPYFVTLSSEISNPRKTKKIHVSKNNKENGNQTNKSFMISEAINSSRTTQKDTLGFTTINYNFSTINS